MFPESADCFPPQVQMAMRLVSFVSDQQRDKAWSSFGGGESRMDGRDLTPKERAAYEAAMEVIRLYMTGEHSFTPQTAAPEGK